MAPTTYSDIGKRVKDLLTKDYNFDQKLTLTTLSETGMGFTASGVIKRDHFSVGDLSTQYNTGNTSVDVKVDTDSNVTTTVTLNEIFPRTRAVLSFKLPDHKSGKISMTVTAKEIIPFTRAVLSFKVPNHKSGKLNMQYLHRYAAIDSSIGLTSTPFVDLTAAIGTKELSLGGEIGFDTATASITKCNAGIGLKKANLSTALMLADKGETLKTSCIHANPINGATIAAEMTHRLSTYENSFAIGTSCALDHYTVVKTRFSDKGRYAMLCQLKWRRPNSLLLTLSAEHDFKAIKMAPRLGLSLALKP